MRSIGTRAAEIVTLEQGVLLWNTLLANSNDGTDNLMCVAEVYLDPNHDVACMQLLFRDFIYACPLTKTHQPVIVAVSAGTHRYEVRLKAYPLEAIGPVYF